jgi:hypothetical protein
MNILMKRKCRGCRNEFYATDLYPRANTTIRPKPPMRDRYRWCRLCWINKTSGKSSPGVRPAPELTPKEFGRE